MSYIIESWKGSSGRIPVICSRKHYRLFYGFSGMNYHRRMPLFWCRQSRFVCAYLPSPYVVVATNAFNYNFRPEGHFPRNIVAVFNQVMRELGVATDVGPSFQLYERF